MTGKAAAATSEAAAARSETLAATPKAAAATSEAAAASPETLAATSETAPPTYGYTAEKEALINRLHRIEGQVRGIERMLEHDRYCIDIITQISAVTTALEAVAFRILDEHVRHCVAGALASGDEQLAAEKSRELLDAVHRFARAR